MVTEQKKFQWLFAFSLLLKEKNNNLEVHIYAREKWNKDRVLIFFVQVVFGTFLSFPCPSNLKEYHSGPIKGIWVCSWYQSIVQFGHQ